MHNGIDYGMLQAYGESFEILHARQSGQDESFSTALPNEFGGHAINAE
jgi:6-phosphogluconate dehydrogenase (decarboxylating)